MPGYQVIHAYRATRDGQQFGPWKKGEVVELTEHDADWVNRDSPGCLTAAAAEGEAPARQKQAGADRQHRGGRNRSSS